MDRVIELIKIYFKTLFTFTILLLVWLYFHELIHFSVCEILIHQNATITVNYHNDFAFMTQCGAGTGFTNIEGYKIFLYNFSPYLVEIFMLYFLLEYKSKSLALRILPYIMASDGIYNFFIMFLKVGDFYSISSLSPFFLMSSFVISISIIILFASILSRDFKDYKRLKAQGILKDEITTKF